MSEPELANKRRRVWRGECALKRWGARVRVVCARAARGKRSSGSNNKEQIGIEYFLLA